MLPALVIVLSVLNLGAHSRVLRSLKEPRDVQNASRFDASFRLQAQKYSRLGVPPDPFIDSSDDKFTTRISNYHEPSIPISGAKDVMFACVSSLLSDVSRSLVEGFLRRSRNKWPMKKLTEPSGSNHWLKRK